MGFRVWCSGFRVQDLGIGLRVWGLGFGVWVLGFGIWGLGFGVEILGLETGVGSINQGIARGGSHAVLQILERISLKGFFIDPPIEALYHDAPGIRRPLAPIGGTERSRKSWSASPSMLVISLRFNISREVGEGYRAVL